MPEQPSQVEPYLVGTGALATAEEPASVRRSRVAWRRLRYQLQSIRPRDIMRMLMIVGAVYAIAWLGWATWPALAPFVAGAVMAYILLPIVNRLDRYMPRGLAVLLTVGLMAATVGGLLSLLVPALVRQATMFIQLIPSPDQLRAMVDQAREFKSTLPEGVQLVLVETAGQATNSLRSNLLAYWARVLALAIGSSISVFSTVGFVLGFLVVPGWLLSVLNEQRTGVSAINRMLPRVMLADFWAVMRIVDRAFSAFIRGQLVLAVVVGFVTYLFLRLFDLFGVQEPGNQLLIATINGMLQLVPQIGPIIAVLLAAALGLTKSTETAIAMVALVIGVNMLVGRFVSPHLDRRVTDIHPTVLVLAIVALSELGIIWILLAAPAATVARDLFRYAFGRFSEPPRPAGVLPGTPIPARRSTETQPANPTKSGVPSSTYRSQRTWRSPTRSPVALREQGVTTDDG